MTNSICPHCGEQTQFRPTTDAENPIWFTCESCEEKVTKINHRYSPKIPTDAIIIPFEIEPVDEPENDFDKYDEKLVLDLQVKKAERIYEAEEELKEEKIERKKSLIEQEEIRKEVTHYFDEDDEEEEELDIYEPSFTDELAKLLRVYQIKKVARQTIIQQSKRLETEGDFVHPNDLKEKLIGIAKVTDKVANIIMKDYQDLIRRFDGRVEEDYYPSRRTRDYDRPSFRRDRPEPMNIQDFIQMEQAKQAREAIQDQLADKDFQIQSIMQEKDKIEDKLLRIEEELRGAKREHKEEIKELQARIEDFRDRIFDAKIEKIQAQSTAGIEGDLLKIADKAIDKGVFGKALSTISDLNRPLPPTQQRQAQLPPPQPVAKEEVQEVGETDEILSAFNDEDIID